ncbi:NADPH-dependent FMN reductase [Ramlibacter sp. PS4R-6]|uniref:NADPH-dependent FMN reductase n=1 Tax=Ramlibacter sp. PS4R-6 TaxID=3133438 RepID=UPI0030A639B9
MAQATTIGVVVGSIRPDSINRKLALALGALAPEGWTLEHIRIDDLPLYNQDDDKNPAASVKRLKADIARADGILIVTPEYNRSIPGVLKNAIDHASRPYGQSAWAGKPAGVIGTSGGAIGTALAQQHLRNVMAYLDMPTMGQPEAFVQFKEGLFDDKGRIANDATKQFLQKWMDSYVAWVQRHTEQAAEKVAYV